MNFVNEDLIPGNIWGKAYLLTQDVDIDDTDFVALTLYIKGVLWTGDKDLYNGLKSKDLKKFMVHQSYIV